MARPITPEWTRFWPKVEVTEGCWIWNGSRNEFGYGLFVSRRNKHHKAHRFCYEFFHGRVSKKKDLDHLCRNPSCVNPRHLEPVSHRENILRGKFAPREKCSYGHPFTPANTRIRKSSSGFETKVCRTCDRWWAAKTNARLNGKIVASREVYNSGLF
jgi:hypothetical protein